MEQQCMIGHDLFKEWMATEPRLIPWARDIVLTHKDLLFSFSPAGDKYILHRQSCGTCEKEWRLRTNPHTPLST